MKEICKLCLGEEHSHSHTLSTIEQEITTPVSSPANLEQQLQGSSLDSAIQNITANQDTALTTFITYDPELRRNNFRVYIKDGNLLTRPAQPYFSFNSIRQRFDKWLQQAQIPVEYTDIHSDTFNFEISEKICQQDITMSLGGNDHLIFVECIPAFILYSYDTCLNTFTIKAGTRANHIQNGRYYIKGGINFMTISANNDKKIKYKILQAAEDKNIELSSNSKVFFDFIPYIHGHSHSSDDVVKAIIDQKIPNEEALVSLIKDAQNLKNNIDPTSQAYQLLLPVYQQLGNIALQLVPAAIESTNDNTEANQINKPEPSLVEMQEEAVAKIGQALSTWAGIPLNFQTGDGLYQFFDKIDTMLNPEKSTEEEAIQQAKDIIQLVGNTLLSIDFFKYHLTAPMAIKNIIEQANNIQHHSLDDFGQSVQVFYSLLNEYCQKLQLNHLFELNLPDLFKNETQLSLLDKSEETYQTAAPPGLVNVDFSVVIGNKKVPVSLILKDNTLFKEFQEFVSMLTQDYSLVNIQKQTQTDYVPALGEALAESQASNKKLQQELQQVNQNCTEKHSALISELQQEMEKLRQEILKAKQESLAVSTHPIVDVPADKLHIDKIIKEVKAGYITNVDLLNLMASGFLDLERLKLCQAYLPTNPILQQPLPSAWSHRTDFDPITHQEFLASLPQDKYGLVCIENFGEKDMLNDYCLAKNISYEYHLEEPDAFGWEVERLSRTIEQHHRFKHDRDYYLRYRDLVSKDLSNQFNDLVSRIYKLPLHHRSNASLLIQSLKQKIIELNTHMFSLEKSSKKELTGKGGFKRADIFNDTNALPTEKYIDEMVEGQNLTSLEEAKQFAKNWIKTAREYAVNASFWEKRYLEIEKLKKQREEAIVFAEGMKELPEEDIQELKQAMNRIIKKSYDIFDSEKKYDTSELKKFMKNQNDKLSK